MEGGFMRVDTLGIVMGILSIVTMLMIILEGAQ
jgi:hypothetical protein